MTDYELKNIDSEEIEDLLVKVETSFDIKFGDTELIHITTFGQLCDHIADKICNPPYFRTVIFFTN